MIAGTAMCVYCGHPRHSSPIVTIPPRSDFSSRTAWLLFALTAASFIPVLLLLYLAPSSDGTRHCAEIVTVHACGLAGALIELVLFGVPWLALIAAAIVGMERLFDPSKVGPTTVAAIGLVLPWMYAVAHLVGAFRLE